jgi:hypothetical protein
MTSYRVTEYDETPQGRPSFLVVPDSKGPLTPVLYLVSESAWLWSAFREDGTRFPRPPREAVRAARHRLRELEASGHYGPAPRPGHYHDLLGLYDYCADPACPRTAQPGA